MIKLFDFDFSNFKGDLLGGITSGIVALPLALAFGVSSGLGPSAGLYGAILVGFFAILFDGNTDYWAICSLDRYKYDCYCQYYGDS